MHEYEKKMQAIMLIADTLNPMAIRGVSVSLDLLAHKKDGKCPPIPGRLPNGACPPMNNYETGS